MALRYGYFDSEIIGYDKEGMPILDRAESSDLLCLIFAMLLNNGVLAKPSDCFQVMEDEGMRLKVKAGFGLIKGHFAYDDEESEIWIPNAPETRTYKRIDAVVLRLNNLERRCEIIVKEGIPETNPVAPELIKSAAGDFYELSLAEIRINANQTVITQSNITDTRADSNKCGFITQFIDSIETSVFFTQLNAFYEEFVLKSDRSYEEFLAWEKEKKEEITTWKSNEEAETDAWQEEQSEEFTEWATDIVNRMESWMLSKTENWQNEIMAWFNNLREHLTENAEVHLQEQIGNLAQLETKEKDSLVDAINSLPLSYNETLAILAGVKTVNVTLSADDGESVVGQTVTLLNIDTEEEVTKNYEEDGISFEVYGDIEYSLSVSDMEDYFTPGPTKILIEEGEELVINLEYRRNEQI